MHLHTPDILSERAGPVVSNFHSANTVEMVMHSAGRPVLICIIGAMQCHIHVLILVVAFPGIQPNIVMPVKLLLSLIFECRGSTGQFQWLFGLRSEQLFRCL